MKVAVAFDHRGVVLRPRVIDELVCLPLRVEGSDGAPARAILIGGRH
jgi:kynurenine formamidase